MMRRQQFSWRAGWVILALGLAGCAASQTSKRWMEEVLLEDGSIIQVERRVVFNETNALGGGAYNAVEKASTLRFTGERAGLPEWSVPLRPIVLYRDSATNEWVVVAATTSCSVWQARGQPNPPYWEYRLGVAGWVQEPLSPTSIGRGNNLLRHYQNAALDGVISIAQKAVLDRDVKTLAEMTFVEHSYRVVVGDTKHYFCN
jgi:hypothetical protein